MKYQKLHTMGFHLHDVQGTFWSDDYSLNLYLGGGKISVYICKNSPSCTVKISEHYSMLVIPHQKIK